VIDGWQRHDLLRVDPHAPTRSSANVAFWLRRGWPVIVRRYLTAEDAGLIPAAISLPGDPVNLGVTLQLRPEHVLERVDPVLLQRATEHAPQAWLGSLQALQEIGERLDSPPMLFGSLLWQTITGLSFIRQHSDLDLIWRIAGQAQAVRLAQAIAGCDAVSPMRIDGEFVLPDGCAVNWREFHRCGQEILVKSLHRVESRPLQALFAA
jgi:phosphoribosyl-dephospho-CoA transferase